MVDGLDEALENLEGKAEVTPTREAMVAMITRLVELDKLLGEPLVLRCPHCQAIVTPEELQGGVGKLETEKAALRTQLKGLMNKEQMTKVVEEVSGYEATLRPSFSKEWHLEPLRKQLTKEEQVACIVEEVNTGEVQKLIDEGRFSMKQLMATGVVTERVRSVALFLRPLKGL